MVHEHTPERPPYDVAAPSDTMGLRHVELALRDLPFPATRDELLARAGNWRVPVTGSHHHALAEYLEGVPNRRFRDAVSVARAVEKARRRRRG